MIRFVHCVKALPGLSAVDFRRHFHSNELSALMDQIALLTQATEFKLSLTLQIEANLGLMQQRGGAEPYDALIEIWWENGHDLMQLAETAEFQALSDQMEAYQHQFVDFARSSRFFVEE